MKSLWLVDHGGKYIMNANDVHNWCANWFECIKLVKIIYLLQTNKSSTLTSSGLVTKREKVTQTWLSGPVKQQSSRPSQIFTSITRVSSVSVSLHVSCLSAEQMVWKIRSCQWPCPIDDERPGLLTWAQTKDKGI